jgi:hypothetical protein
MNNFDLAWGIIVRMTAWGGAGGTVVGCVYGFLLISFAGNSSLSLVGACVGFLLGGTVGLAAGLVDGLVLAALMHFIPRSTINRIQYRVIIYGVCMFVTTLGAVLGFSSFAASLAGTTLGWMLYILIPTLLAVVIAWKASAEVVTWVRKSIA